MRRKVLSSAVVRTMVFAAVSAIALFPTSSSAFASTGSSAPTTSASSCRAAGEGPHRGSTPRKGTAKLPDICHVFVIMLENEGYDSTFGDPSNDPYLARTLPARGALLANYYAVGHFSLDNYVAFISGQPPNPDTQGDCVGEYAEFPQSAVQEVFDGAKAVQTGTGCIYPAKVQTLAGQLKAKGLTWKAYMQDMGNDPARDGAPSSVCGHPVPNGKDAAVVAVPGDGYATRHDPFVYFSSITGDTAECDADVVPLGSPTAAEAPRGTAAAKGLAADLKSVHSTANFNFITPNLCNDGHDFPCVNQATPPGSSAYTDIDSFLRTWVPLITSSPAFKQSGLLEITFDESDTADATSCCGETPGPTGVQPGETGPGGGRIGSILISPFVKAGTVVKTELNHYSSLASIEDIFGLGRLADAQTVSTNFDGVLKK